MKKLTVKNPKWQARFDAIGGWTEIAVDILFVGITALIIYLCWKDIVL